MGIDEKPSVRRTVIVTAGPLAQATGEYFTDCLAHRGGPHAAVAIVDVGAHDLPSQEDLPVAKAVEDTPDKTFRTVLAQALSDISPPDLGSRLAQAGWRLARPRDLQVFLVADTAADGDRRMQALSQQVIEAAYRHLGLECLPSQIWLATGSPEETAVCLQNAGVSPMGQTILALSLLNEEGLRLAEPAALARLTGELLWCLVATPFASEFAEWATRPGTVTGETGSIITAGLTVWTWSPDRARELFAQRWLQDVLALWLAAPQSAPPAEELHIWLQEHGMDREGLAARLQSKGEQPLTLYAPLARQYPWPWQMRAHLQTLKHCYEEDLAAVADQRQWVAIRQAEILQTANEQLMAVAQEMVDAQPIGGSQATAVWLCALAQTCDDLYEQMLDEAATYDGLDTDLAEERGEIEAHIRHILAAWPIGGWPDWAGILPRPWRWPRLAWRYWRLRQLGLWLATLLAQQSVRQRQKARQAAAGQTLAELARLARQWQGRAGELGEMVGNWQKATASPEVSPPANGVCVGQELPLPVGLYARLVPDRRREAVLAAEAVSGLGRQVGRLDEGVLAELHRLAETRLAGIGQITVVDVLAAAHETPADWEEWRRAAWEAAAPLWRYDEGCLPQTSRRSGDAWSCFIGAGAGELPTLLTRGDGATGDLAQANGLGSGDRQRLFLLRLRRGLTPEAMMMGQ